MSSPIVEVSDKTVFLNSSISGADLFTVTDSDDPIVSYFIQDFSTSATSGYFELNGVSIAHGKFTKIEVDDLVNLRYVGGSQIGRERFRIMARDAAGNFSAASSIGTLYSARPNTTAPYSKAITFSILADEAVAGEGLVWGHDPDGFPIQKFHVRDRDVDFGHFEINGLAQPQGTYFTIDAEDIGQLTYVSTGPTHSELFDVIAFDGQQNSPQSVGWAHTSVNANRPVVRYSTASVDGGEYLVLGDVVNISDADGSTIKKYRFYNTSPHSQHGELLLGGLIQPRLTWVEVSADRIDEMYFVPSDIDNVQEIRVLAFDGKGWSHPSTLAITSRFTGVSGSGLFKPNYVPNTIADIQEQLVHVPVNSLYEKQDSGGAYSAYEIYDPSADPTTGYFAIDEIPMDNLQIHQLSADDFNDRLTFDTGAFYRRSLDTIYVRPVNSVGLVWGNWEKVDIRTEPEIDDVLTGGSDWTTFLPRNSQGDVVITFSYMQQEPTYGGANIGPASQNEHFTIFTENQRAHTRLIFRHLETFANVQFLEVSDTSINSLGGDGGIIRMGEYGDADDPAAAFANLPQLAPVGGDIWFNRLSFGPTIDLFPETLGYKIFLHELGHSMGMKHPHDGTPRLPPTTDFDDFTVMSYIGSPSGWPTTYQLYDIDKLQDLYGVNWDYNTGDDTYSIATTWSDRTVFFETIWDGGGNDTLSAVGSPGPAVVDLRSGEPSSIGVNSNNVNIALRAVIENAMGGDFDDRLIGNAVNNYIDGRDGDDYLYGNRGNDMLTGGAGNDTYEFGISDGIDVIDERNLEGADTLLITPFPGLDSLEEDFTFRMLGNDLHVDLRLNDGASQGLVMLRDQTMESSQVETLELNGVRIDLSNLTAQATSVPTHFQVLTTSSDNGFLVAPA